MSGAAKMHHTEEIKVTVKTRHKVRTYTLPATLKRAVEDFISSQQKLAELEKSIPAEEVLPVLANDAQRPAAMLRASRYKLNMTQKELAERLKAKQHHLSEMENGKRAISKKMARQLAEVFNCDYKVFL